MRYKALNPKADLDPETCLFQAANALDAAGEVAEKTNDPASLVEIAKCWMTFSEGIANFAQFRLMHENEPKSRLEIGFQKSDIIVEENEDD